MQSGASIPSSEWARTLVVPGRGLSQAVGTVSSRQTRAGDRRPLGRGRATVVEPDGRFHQGALRDDTNVYLGKGKTQYRDPLPNGMFMTLTGWPDIDQVYLPNSRGSAFAALQIVRQKIVTTDSFGYEAPHACIATFPMIREGQRVAGDGNSDPSASTHHDRRQFNREPL